jgi:hypothetical protein
MKGYLNKMIGWWLGASTPEQAAATAAAIVEYKQRVAEALSKPEGEGAVEAIQRAQQIYLGLEKEYE